MNLATFLSVNSEDILRYLDIGLNVAFFGILGVLVFLFLWGLLHGWRYGTYHLIFVGGLCVIGMLTVSPLGDMLAKLDLSSFGIPEVVVNIGDFSASLHVTTLSETLTDFFTKLLLHYGVSASAEDIVVYATALAASTVKLLLIFVEGLLIMIVGSLLAWLLWHICFKFLFNRKVQVTEYLNGPDGEAVVKKKRRKRKLRWVSGLEHVVCGGLIMVMLLTPFTALVNTVNNHLEIDESSSKTDETVGMVYDVLEAYDDSTFAKVFFNWTRNDGTETLDSKLISFLTKTDAAGMKVDLITELASIADVGSSILNSGVMAMIGEDGIAWHSILASMIIPNLISKLTSVSLVKIALPVAVTIALNLDQAKTILGEDAVAYLTNQNYDWTNELNNLSAFYVDLLNAGFFEVIADEVSQTPIFNLTQLYAMFEDEDAYKSMHAALDKADTDLINHLIAGAVYTMAKNQETSEDSFSLRMFVQPDKDAPLDYHQIANISWFQELGIIYDSFYSLVDIDRVAMKEMFDGLGTTADVQSLSRLNQNDSSSSEAADEDKLLGGGILGTLLTMVIDHPEEVISVLVGPRDADGNPTNVDPNTGISTGKKNLFDSVLIGNALDDLLPVLEPMVNNQGNIKIDLESANAQLVDEDNIGVTRVNFKKEFGAIMDIAAELASNEAGKEFLLNPDTQPGVNYDPEGNLYSIEPDLLDALINTCEDIDRSIILSSALPGVLESSMEDFDLSQYGIAKLDFHAPNLGHEAANILRMAKYCPLLVSSFSSISKMGTAAMGSFLLSAQEELCYIFDTFLNSKVLNPITLDENGKEVKNANFCGLINKLISQIDSNGTFTELTTEDLDGIPNLTSSWIEGDIDQSKPKGETYQMVNALCSVLRSGLLDKLDSLSNGDTANAFSQLSGLKIDDVFAAIGDSVILSKLAGGALDGYLVVPILGVGGEDGLDLPISFKNVTDWAAEGAAFQKVIDLASKGLDLSNLDFFALGPDLGDLLKALSGSGIFTYTESGVSEYVFPEYLYNKLLLSTDGETLKYFLDPDFEGDVASLTTLEEKQAATTLLYLDMVEQLSTEEDWNGEQGEIDRLTNVLNSLNQLGGVEELSNLDFDNLSSMEQALSGVAESHALGRVILYNGLKNAFAGMEGAKDSPIDFSAINYSYFLHADPVNGHLSTLTEKQRQDNVDEVANLFSVFSVLLDPSYGLMNEDGQLDASRISLSSLSTDFLLRPLLDGASASHLLNEAPTAEQTPVFKQLIETVLVESGIYGIDENAEDKAHVAFDPDHTDMTIAKIVESISDWDSEIDDLCYLIDTIQSSSFVDENGELDFDALSSPSDYFATNADDKKRELSTMLNALDGSALFYRALPQLLNDVFFPESGEELIEGEMGEFLNDVNPFFTAYEDNGTKDYAPYGEEQIDYLVNMMGSLSSLSSTDLTDLGSIDASALTTALDQMMRSGLFNSDKLNETTGLNAFQGLIKQIVSLDALEQYFYYVKDDGTGSPKDLANKSLYAQYDSADLANGKAIYLVKSVFPTKFDGNDSDLAKQELAIDGDEGSLKTMLTLFQSDEVKPLLNNDGVFDFSSIRPDLFVDLLTALNDSPLFYDCVPNIIDSTLNQPDFQIEGIDFTKANVYFSYYYDENDQYHSEPDYSRRFDETEIYQLASILSNLSRNSEALGNLTNLSSIDPITFREILTDMYNSRVFHNDGFLVYGGNSAVWNEGTFTYDDLTVFEQLAYTVYDSSSLASLNYSLEGDPELYLAHGEAGYQEKLYKKIKAQRTPGWTEEINNLTDDGRGAGLLQVFLDSGFVADDGSLTFSGDEIMNLPPDDLEDIFYALNKLQLGSDILPNALQDVFGNVGLTQFTRPAEPITVEATQVGNEYVYDIGAVAGNLETGGHPLTITLDKIPTEYSLKAGEIDYTDFAKPSEGSSIDVASLTGNLVLTSSEPLNVQVSYDLSNYRYTQSELEKKDINLIINLLNSIYTPGIDGQDGHYFDFANIPDGYDVMTAFTEQGHHTYDLLTFMQQTSIFENPIEFKSGTDFDAYHPVKVASENSVTTRDYALYHIFTLDISFGQQSTFKASIFNRLVKGDNSEQAAINALNEKLGSALNYPDLKVDSLYVDDHIIDLAFVEGYVTAVEALVDSLGDDDTANAGVYAALVALNQGARIDMLDAVDAFSSFTKVDENSENLEDPVLFNNILAGEMDAIYGALVKADYINHNLSYGTTGANPGGLYTNTEITVDSYKNLGSFYDDDWMALINDGSAQEVFYANLMAYAFTDEKIATYATDECVEGLLAMEKLDSYFNYGLTDTVFVTGKEKLGMLSSYLYLSLPYSGIVGNSNLSDLSKYKEFKVGDNQVNFSEVALGLATNASIILL